MLTELTSTWASKLTPFCVNMIIKIDPMIKDSLTLILKFLS
jgi:hypothetical protein